MTFEAFQNYARLYVIGALELDEMEKFERAREQYGSAAGECLDECNRVHESLQLSLKPADKARSVKTRLLSLVSRRNPALLRA